MTDETPLQIANTFIQRYGKEAGIEHLKLQKLVYFAYGWWLSSFDKPLTSEAPQVWKYGPVFNSLYKALRSFGRTPVPTPQSADPFSEPEIVKDQKVSRLIDWVWEKYGSRTGTELSDMTHMVGTPWQKEAERHKYLVPENHPIDVNLIKAFFRKEKCEAQRDEGAGLRGLRCVACAQPRPL